MNMSMNMPFGKALRTFRALKALKALKALRALRALRALKALKALRALKALKTLTARTKSTKIIRSEFFAGGLSKNAKFFKIVGTPASISSSRPSQKLLSRPNVLRSSREHAADGPRV